MTLITIKSPWVGQDSSLSHPLEYYFSSLSMDTSKGRDHWTRAIISPGTDCQWTGQSKDPLKEKLFSYGDFKPYIWQLTFLQFFYYSICAFIETKLFQKSGNSLFLIITNFHNTQVDFQFEHLRRHADWFTERTSRAPSSVPLFETPPQIKHLAWLACQHVSVARFLRSVCPRIHWGGSKLSKFEHSDQDELIP